MWSIAGLAFGAVLGGAGAYGGLRVFLPVLLLGVVGFLIGRALEVGGGRAAPPAVRRSAPGARSRH